MLTIPDPRRPRRRRSVALITAGLTLVVLLNAIAWMRAWSATHFAPEGRPPTPFALMSPPEKLGVLLGGLSMPRPRNVTTPREVGLSFNAHRIELAGEEWLEGWHVPHQRARGVVALFHGYGASKESLLRPAAAFHRLGFATFLVDFRGYGGSSSDTTTLGLREADDVAATIAYIRRTWPDQPLVLYGESMGASAVLRALAATRVQPAAVILDTPFDRLLTTIRRRFAATPAPPSPLAELVLFWGGVQQGVNGFEHNPVDDAAAVACPALLLRGERDPWVTADDIRAVRDRLAGPKQLVELGAGGHGSLAHAAPVPWTAAVAGFLDDIVPGRA